MTANLMRELINETASCLLPEANATSGCMTVSFMGPHDMGDACFF